MTLITSFHYNTQKREAMLLAAPDGTQIPLHVYHIPTYEAFKSFDHTKAPCALKFRRLELAYFAESRLGATRVGTLVFVQSSVAQFGPMNVIAEEVFFRQSFESWLPMFETVDKNDSAWTEIRTIGAESRQLKYNILHNPKASGPGALYDMFLAGDAVLMRKKSARENNILSPGPYVFNKDGLFGIQHAFPHDDGNWSTEIQSHLTQAEE